MRRSPLELRRFAAKSPLPTRTEPAILDTLALLPLAAVPPDAVERLLDDAFGPDRHGRTAYRLREGATALASFSFAAVEDGALAASLQSWPVEIAGDDGRVEPLVLVGPIAVRPDRQGTGLGRRITAHALAALDKAGVAASTLVGDPEYYGRFFGYAAEPAVGWRLPGPVEQRRVLARMAPGVDLPTHGILRRARP